MGEGEGKGWGWGWSWGWDWREGEGKKRGRLNPHRSTPRPNTTANQKHLCPRPKRPDTENAAPTFTGPGP